MQYPAESYQIGQQIIQAILTGSSSQTILSQIASKLGKWFQVETCAVIADNPSLVNSVQIGWWHSEQIAVSHTDKLSDFFASSFSELSVEGASKFWVTADQQTQPLDFLNKQDSKIILPFRALLGFVTHFQGKVNGVILLGKSQPYQWTSSEQELLKKVAESVAIAISQIQLQQQAQTKTRYQTLLCNLSQQISQNLDIDSIFRLALAEIGAVLQVERCLVLTLKYKDPLLTQRSRQYSPQARLQVAHSWSTSTGILEITEPYSFRLKNSTFCQKALKQAPEPLAIAEQSSFPDLQDNQIPAWLDPQSTSALLMMPLMGNMASETKPALVLGFLVLQHRQRRLWQTDELDLLNWISIQISTAIIHHQTLNQVQSIVEERTAQLKWSLDVQAKLSEKMRQQIDQLRQLNELKDDFLSSMSHELKTPLTSMKMAIKMLRQPNLPETMRERYLNILEHEWNREYNLIKDLLTLQQVESGEFTATPQQLNLYEVVEPLAQAFVEKWQPDRGLVLTTDLSDPGLSLYADPESLEHILNELLLNAGKYSDADTTVELAASVQASPKGSKVVISLSNYGAGISSEEMPYIFEKFRRGKGVTDRAVPGTGLGLALVKYLVEHLNGTIDVASQPTDEANVYLNTFTLKLPQLEPPNRKAGE